MNFWLAFILKHILGIFYHKIIDHTSSRFYSEKEIQLENTITQLNEKLTNCQSTNSNNNDLSQQNSEIQQLQSKIEELTKAKTDSETNSENLNQKLILANAEIDNLKADLGSQPKLSDRLNDSEKLEKDFKTKEKQMTISHNQELEQLSLEYNIRLANMKNHYENPTHLMPFGRADIFGWRPFHRSLENHYCILVPELSSLKK